MAKSSGRGKGGAGARDLHVKVKTARGRKISSTKWLQRQLNDPYVVAAKRDGYRSRAAYKLLEIDDKYKILKPGQNVIDLGCAPGGWAQIAEKRVKATAGEGKVAGIDLLDMEPIAGVHFIQGDFTDDDAPENLMNYFDGQKANIVMSDMAAAATGHKQTDHLRIIGLCEIALDFAQNVLDKDGVFLAKVLQGGTENELLNLMKRDFSVVRHVKPKASRADSSELYVLATGFRGNSEDNTG